MIWGPNMSHLPRFEHNRNFPQKRAPTNPEKSNELIPKSVDCDVDFPILGLIRVFLKNPKLTLLPTFKCLSPGTVSEKSFKEWSLLSVY